MTNMNKRNGNKKNWKETSMTWQAAEEIVFERTGSKEFKAVRKMQLRIKYTITLFIVVSIIVATKIILTFPVELGTEDTHKWEACDCFYSYDHYGYYSNQSPFTYHCATHGHDCEE